MFYIFVSLCFTYSDLIDWLIDIEYLIQSICFWLGTKIVYIKKKILCQSYFLYPTWMKSQVWSRLRRIDYMKRRLFWFVGASASRTVVQYNSIYLAFHLSVLYLSSLGFFVLPIFCHFMCGRSSYTPYIVYYPWSRPYWVPVENMFSNIFNLTFHLEGRREF